MGGLIFLAAIALLVGNSIWTHRHMIWLRFHYLPVTLQSKNLGVQPFAGMYPKLTDEFKRKFQWRAFYFLHTTEIRFLEFDGYSRQHREMIRHLLASVAAQMTLFLPEKCFTMIHTILVYPKPYFSRLSKR